MLEDGRVFVSGGDNGNASSVRGTSTFNYTTQAWTRIQDLAVGRWYNGSVALPSIPIDCESQSYTIYTKVYDNIKNRFICTSTNLAIAANFTKSNADDLFANFIL